MLNRKFIITFTHSYS